jgi:hypothetical protein
MAYQIEFPDFDPATLPAIPTGWIDQSWHNDLCPCFNTNKGLVVFIDFADLSQREWDDGKRFTVHTDPEVTNGNDVLFESDDWAEVLAFVAQRGA